MTTNTASHDMRACEVWIIGPRHLQNALLADFLRRELETVCHLAGSAPVPLPATDAGVRIVLLDALDITAEGFSNWYRPLSERLSQADRPLLLNLAPDQRIDTVAVSAGVRGIFYPTEPPARIARGVRAVCNGELWVSRGVLTEVILKENGPAVPDRRAAAGLTRREIEILSLVAIGSSNEEVADRLCISPHTVKTHVYNIFKKIGVPNRFQAALWATKYL